MTIEKVIANNYCIGCGACKFHLKEYVDISMKPNGFYKATIKEGASSESLKASSEDCPFSSSSSSEDQLSNKLFDKKLNNFDERVGYYNNIFVGKVLDSESRVNSSSGGMTTWFAEKLFLDKKIDAVIHVSNSEHMFEYSISRTLEDIQSKGKKKSRYYPVTFSGLVEEITQSNERFLFIGIPCFVKSIRLLQNSGTLNNISYTFSLLCGHMKSALFAENLAWQVGIPPKKLQSVDFRVKRSGHLASDYFIEAKDIDEKTLTHRNRTLLGANWGHGFFKHKSCDFCDDLSGELADMAFGDAWLPEYTNDHLGTNIVISRSPELEAYLLSYASEVFYKTATVSDFYETQAGNYRHRRDGLPFRLEFQKKKEWCPSKRTYLASDISKGRERLYTYRYRLSQVSGNNFLLAKKYNSYKVFKILMFPYLVRYEYINTGLKSMVKLIIRSLLPGKLKKAIRK